MEGRPSYRVYSPTDLKSIAPATLRTGSPPRKHGFFGFGLVTMVIVVFVGGATFATQHYVDVKLAQNAAAKRDSAVGSPAAPPAALAAPSPFAMSLSGPGLQGSIPGAASDAASAPSLTSATPAVPSPASSAEAAANALLNASKLRKKAIHRGLPPVAAPPTSALPGVPGFVKPSSDIPANPYEEGK